MNRFTPIWKSGWICLLLGLVLPASSRAAEPTLTSIASTTNGVRLTWEDPTPDQAYTVQIRESLTNGTWRNATTRYRWPWPHPHWGDAPRSLPAARYYRVVSEPAVAPNRGMFRSSTLKGQWDAEFQNRVYTNWGISSFVHAKYGVVSRSFVYETVDPFGLSITASALLILPMGNTGPLPLASVQHGTTARKVDAPSQPNSGDMWASVLASLGYAVVVPDYLGLGTSPGYQAYLHAKSEATCVVDALRAGKALCASNQVTLDGRLFLTGFSQGGHVTMAAQKELETLHSEEFTVTASAPCAGTYDMGGATLESLLNDPNYPIAYPFAMIVASYLPIYQLGDTLEELLAEPYRRTLPPLLDGKYDETQIEAALPKDPIAILRPDYQAEFRSNPNHPLRQALNDNTTYRWTPKAPTRLIHCRGDRIARFGGAETAYQSFTDHNACCVSLVDPGAPQELGHEDCYIPSLREVLSWFASF